MAGVTVISMCLSYAYMPSFCFVSARNSGKSRRDKQSIRRDGKEERITFSRLLSLARSPLFCNPLPGHERWLQPVTSFSVSSCFSTLNHRSSNFLTLHIHPSRTCREWRWPYNNIHLPLLAVRFFVLSHITVIRGINSTDFLAHATLRARSPSFAKCVAEVRTTSGAELRCARMID